MAIKKFSPLLAENPLCGIGEYKDVLDLSTGGVTRRIKKVIVTGDEDWHNSTVAASGIGVVLTITDMLINGRINGYCSHFIAQFTPSSSTINGITFGASNNAVCITFSASTATALNLTDTQSIKSYFASQNSAGIPVTIWYVLATPETETITVPSGLTGTIEGYLTQSGTPTPSAPIYPEANPALAWVPTNYRKYGTETEIITILPAQIIGDGQPITSCQISGNMNQNGTPTPEAPVDVVGCGTRTGNLFDLSTATMEFINRDGSITPTSAENPYYLSDYISADNVTISVQYKETAASETFSVGIYDSSKNFIRRDDVEKNSVSYENVAYIRVNYRDKNCQNVMINSGSTALPYEPYGYKLPLTVNGTEYPIYLGQVPTTRRIKKLVLTGEEATWNARPNTTHTFQVSLGTERSLNAAGLHLTIYQ